MASAAEPQRGIVERTLARLYRWFGARALIAFVGMGWLIAVVNAAHGS
jgi:hypothetical protein